MGACWALDTAPGARFWMAAMARLMSVIVIQALGGA